MQEDPTISIVIVNYNGRRHLPECLKTIMRMNYPKDKLEVVVVDNGSTDGSVEYLESRWKSVRLLKNSSNEGFAGPSDDGAAAATGEYVVFLNNDMRVDRNWLREMLATAERTNADCVGSTILNWDGSKIDFIGGGITFYGRGHQYHYNEPAARVEELAGNDPEIMFACGGAMLIKRDVFNGTGGFDRDYFAYFEDVDFGWRLWAEGYRAVLSTKSIVYHKHNSTSKTMPKERLDVLYLRNKLSTSFKNMSDTMLQKLFWPSLMFDMRQAFLASGIDAYEFNMQNPDVSDSSSLRVNRAAAAKFVAINEFLTRLPKLKEQRQEIQSRLRISDEKVRTFFEEAYVVFPSDTAELVNYEYDLVKTFDIDHTIGQEFRLRVLLISNDRVGEKMAGPGIRYWEIAKSLVNTGKFDVYLACPDECGVTYPGIHTVSYTMTDNQSLCDVATKSHVIMVQGFVLDTIPKLRPITEKKFVIVDIYDPFMIENIEVFKDKDRGFRNKRHQEALTSLKYQLQLGDFFVCANEKQRDYWIGMLSAFNRVTPGLYDVDRAGDRLVEIVPFGISDMAPEHRKNVLKGVWPGIRATDKVLIWGGGVWNWFDPLTLIRAIHRISQTRDDVKLFFMGVRHPNPAVPQMKMLAEAVELAKKLDVYDKFVFFNYGWVDYNDRQNYLMEADIGVSCHFKTLETRFSFRTRILDYLWADLPIICTKGDYFAQMVEHEKLGRVVDFKDDEGLAAAITSLLDDTDYFAECRRNVAKVAETYKWSRITKPIIEYCKNPVQLGMRHLDYGAKESTDERPVSSEMSGHTPARLNLSGGGSVRDKITDVQARQDGMDRELRRMRRQNDRIYDIALELQVWSYMMNDRFNKVKRAFNPFRGLIRRLRHGR